MSVENQVREIIAEQLGISEEEIQLNSIFTEDLGADSLDLVELVMAVEEEFEIEISDEEAEKINAVKDLVYFLEHRSQ